MFIISGSKAASIKEKQIDAPISKIWIKGNIKVNGIKFTSNPGLKIIDALNNALISIQKQTANGNVPLLLPIGLGSIAEICSNQEGHLNCFMNDYPADGTGDRNVSFELQIELSRVGALRASDGKFILLSLDMSASEITELDIYGVEFPVQTETYTSYKQLKVNANTQKSINVIGKDVISLPRTGFQQLDIIYPDRTVTFKEDIKVITQSIENMVLNYVSVYNDLENNPGAVPSNCYAQTYFDGVKYHTIGLQGAIEVKVLYNCDTMLITSEQQS